MNTKAVCRRMSVTPKMLRIYEEQGLIKPQRLENNYRDYSLENLVQIETISILRRLGFSTGEIRSIISFDKTENEYLDMFYLQYKAIESQINELKEKKEELRGTVNKMLISRGSEDINEMLLTGGKSMGGKFINYDDIVNAWNFDEMASDFIDRYMKEDIPYQRTIKRLREMIGETGGTTFADVGCGICNLWDESDDGMDVVAIDKSLPMLLESRKRLPWIKPVMDDILTLDPEEYRKNDVVVAAFMIHHIEYGDQFRAIDNIFSICRDGGTVLIADRCYRDPSMKGSDPTEFFVIADEIGEYLAMKGADPDTEYTDDSDEGMVIFRAVKRS